MFMKKKEIGNAQDADKKYGITGEIWSFLKDMVVSLLIVFFVVQVLVRPVQVVGHSMDPTLQDQSYGFSNVLGTKLGHLDRFDIVIVYVEEKDEYLVKRIIGMPGETVSYQGGQLYINGNAVAEPFLDTEYAASYPEGTFMNDVDPIILGEDEYYCLGDNRPHSTDSRYYGPFHKKDIAAKGLCVFWPLNAIGVKTW